MCIIFFLIIQQFNNLVASFESFCQIYEYCLLDNNIIFSGYQSLLEQKILILTIINSFIFSTDEIEYENILIKHKIAVEILLNGLLSNLLLLYKKKIYYDGYNINSKNIDTCNILPYNFLYDINYKNTNQFNIQNLTVF